VEVDVPVAGKTKVTGVPIKLSASPGAVRTAPPSLGQHTDEVLKSVLGLDASVRKKLRDEGVV
jgi:crotonobetainyl-CoA:carnitine CoA-transferase CaiB-like acyl-CoA transferase